MKLFEDLFIDKFQGIFVQQFGSISRKNLMPAALKREKRHFMNTLKILQ